MKLFQVCPLNFRERPGTRSLLSILVVLVSLSAQGADLKVGFAEFKRQSSGLSPATSALFSLRNPEGILVSEAGVEAVSPTRQGRIFVQRTSSVQTGIAFANSSDQSVILRLILRDESGKEIGRVERFELRAHEHLARFVEQLFTGVPASFLGSLTFEGISPSDKLGAVTIRQSQNSHKEPLLTTLPVVDLDSAVPAGTSLIFPHLGAGPGFATQLVLINPFPSVTAGQIHLISSDGRPLSLQLENGVGSKVPFQIPANGVFLTELNLPPGVNLGVGYARVEVTQGTPPSGTAVFRFVENQQPISEAGVAVSPAMRKARLFVDRRGTSTGFALVNPNSNAITLHLRLYDANGTLIEEHDQSLQAKNHLSKFVNEFFSLPDRFVGILEIEAAADFVPITLKLSQNSRKKSILTTLPVANMSSPDSGTLLVVPQLGAGESTVGDFQTSLIFIAPLQEPSVQAALKFWQGDGRPLGLGGISSELGYALEAGAAGEILLSDQVRKPPVTERGATASSTIGADGGFVFLPDCAGAAVTLEVPPFALLSERKLILTCLKSRPAYSLGKEAFPGVTLAPDGLIFREPAELAILLPEPLKNPKRVSLFSLGVDDLPRPVFEAVASGHLIKGELRHFSEYWGEEANLSDLITWAERLQTFDPATKQKMLELYRKQMGDTEIDELTLQLLVGLSDFEDLRAYEGFHTKLAEELGLAPPDSVALGFLDQLVGEFLAKPVPANACGYYHGVSLRLRALSEAFLGPNPELTNRMAQLDSQCIRTGLDGWWVSVPQGASERCFSTTESQGGLGCPADCNTPPTTGVFTEFDTTEAYRFFITQTGASLQISFPQFPGAPSYHGHLQGTGDAKFPYSFSVSVSGTDSPDCITFFETDGSFEFGDPMCEESPGTSCHPLSCWEQELLQGRVSSSGHLEGTTRWTLVASIFENNAGCCHFLQVLSCRGSGPFTANKE